MTRTWTPTVFVGYAVSDAPHPGAPALPMARVGQMAPTREEPARMTKAQVEQGIAMGLVGAVIGRFLLPTFFGVAVGGAIGFAAPWAFDKLEKMP